MIWKGLISMMNNAIMFIDAAFDFDARAIRPAQIAPADIVWPGKTRSNAEAVI